jgi:hypothetical protein
VQPASDHVPVARAAHPTTIAAAKHATAKASTKTAKTPTVDTKPKKRSAQETHIIWGVGALIGLVIAAIIIFARAKTITTPTPDFAPHAPVQAIVVAETMPAVNGLALHLDASRIELMQVGLVGNVSKWTDASNSTRVAAAPDENSRPTLVKGGHNGLSYMDFGAVGSDRKMAWFSDSSPLVLDNIRAVFMVADGAGFLLCSEDKNHFERAHPLTSAVSPLWQEQFSHAAVRRGVTRINGTVVDGTVAETPTKFPLITVVTTHPVKASRLCWDRALPGRTGGLRIAELIILTEPPSDSDVVAIEAYLKRKWFTPR